MVLHHYLLNGDSIMTLITFQDGSPILKDGKIGIEQACCCGGNEGVCNCFGGAWPVSVTVDFCMLEDSATPGQGQCNCPADGYAALLNQTVVCDFEGTFDHASCGDFRPHTPGNPGVFRNPGDPPVAVYRGTLSAGTCDEYGVEILLSKVFDNPNPFLFPWDIGGCELKGIINGTADGAPGLCDAFTRNANDCNWWAFYGLLSSECDSTDFSAGSDVRMGSSYAGAWNMIDTCTITIP